MLKYRILFNDILYFERLYGDEETIKNFEKSILTVKDEYASYFFAKNIKGANIKAHGEVVINSGHPKFNYEFAKNIKGADTKAHEQVIISSEDPYWCYKFAKDVKGSNIQKLGEIIINSKNPSYNYEIYDTKPIRESVGVKYGESGHRISSDTILEEYNQRRQGFGNRDSESTGYRGETSEDDGLVSGKLQKTRNDETKINVGKSTRNSKELDNSSFSLSENTYNLKQKQLEIINKSNPAPDDNHTWIRSTDDIKTFNEAFFEDGEYSGMDPDFTEDMAQKSINSGKITVYSSYPIEDGTFVSPSKMEASQYAGGDESKLYSKTVNIDDVAWIDGAEGQYAKASDTKYSKSNDKAPVGKYNVYGEDIKIEQDKAPTKNELGYLPKDPTREDSYDFDGRYKKTRRYNY